MTYVSEAIAGHHVTRHFDSGKPNLDEWLQHHSLTTEARRTGRTFVWQDRGRVVAYYTIAAHLIIRDTLPRQLGHGNPSQIPAVLLARLALDKVLQGRGHGSELLAEALQRIVIATQTIAARFIVAEAIDEAAHSFYRHHGFKPTPAGFRLVQKISAVADSVNSGQSM